MDSQNKIFEFISQIFSYINIEDQKYKYFFRGEPELYKSVLPSVYRGNISNKKMYYDDLLLRHPAEFLSEKSTFEKLIKMQHFASPTRLLDITSNPLVALYFSCNEFIQNDGRILILRVPKSKIKYQDSIVVSGISNLCKIRNDQLNLREKGKHETKEDFEKSFRQNSEIQYLLKIVESERNSTLNPLGNLKSEDLKTIWCVLPQLKFARLFQQDGAFLLFGVSGDGGSPCTLGNDNKDKSNIIILEEIKVPKEIKVQLSDYLDIMGVSESKLFPDLEHSVCLS